MFPCRFPGLPVVCSLLLPGKPVAEDDADQGILAGRGRGAGSDHLLLLLHHHLGEGQGRNPACPGSVQSCRARLGFGEVNPAGLYWGKLRGTGGSSAGKLQLGPLSPGSSRLPFLPRPGGFVPIENVLPATISGAGWRQRGADLCTEQVHGMAVGFWAPLLLKGLLETSFAPNFGSTWAEILQPGGTLDPT